MKLKVKFLPYEKLKELSLKDVLADLQKNMIIMVDAKLSIEQETKIIEETMKRISDKFSGIELSSLELTPEKDTNLLDKIKSIFIELIIGKKRGLTVIGPAKIIKKIRKNPEELLLDVSD